MIDKVSGSMKVVLESFLGGHGMKRMELTLFFQRFVITDAIFARDPPRT